MTANSPPYVLQSGSHSAQLFRQAISTLLGAAGGVTGPGDYQVTQNGTPNMSVNIAGGAPRAGGGIWVPGTSSTGVQGLYFGYNDAAVNLPISASNPSNPRIDIAVAQVQDAAYAGATNSFQIAAVAGTPAGSPVAPSLPASSLALANVAVGAAVTSIVTANITDKRVLGTAGPTAWTSLTLATNVAATANSIGVPGIRLDNGGAIRLRGQLVNNTGGTITAGVTIATIPAAASQYSPPSGTAVLASVVNGAGSGTVIILLVQNGVLSLAANWASLGQATLDGVTYTLS